MNYATEKPMEKLTILLFLSGLILSKI